MIFFSLNIFCSLAEIQVHFIKHFTFFDELMLGCIRFLSTLPKFVSSILKFLENLFPPGKKTEMTKFNRCVEKQTFLGSLLPKPIQTLFREVQKTEDVQLKDQILALKQKFRF